jgi:proline dehydrogenase
MHKERARASDLGYADPIHDTVQDTHDCYDGALEYLLREVKSNDFPTIEVMCASHNRESIEKAIELCNELGLAARANDNLSFAQLFGMSDDLTIPLGERGYNVYKYLPYGEIKEVIPYMLRRAQENGDVLGKSKYEMKLVIDELKERIKM